MIQLFLYFCSYNGPQVDRKNEKTGLPNTSPYLANARFGSLCVQFGMFHFSQCPIRHVPHFSQCPIRQSLCPIQHGPYLANAQSGTTYYGSGAAPKTSITNYPSQLVIPVFFYLPLKRPIYWKSSTAMPTVENS